MIDTRFPPQPQPVRVPLYPISGDLWSILKRPFSSSPSESDLKKWIAHQYEVDPSNIHLSGKGSYSLYLLLTSLRAHFSNPLRVALPAFCCHDICHAIIAAGANPVFIDLAEDLTASPSSIEYIKGMGCQVLIWPQLFGRRQLSDQIVDMIKESGILLINDEAQVFPLSEKCCRAGDVSLFSFGHSKKLAGKGGGGICFHRKELSNLFDEFVDLFSDETGSLLCEIKNHLKVRLTQSNRALATKLNLAGTLEEDLKVLLEKNSFLHKPFPASPLDSIQIYFLQKRILDYRPEHHVDRSNQLKQIVEEVLGNGTCHFLDNIQEPTIFAIRVRPENRYAICEKLAKKGIQTTWYYFPLNKLSFLWEMPSEQTPMCQQISSEIIVLPFQWRHSSRQFNDLINALKSLEV